MACLPQAGSIKTDIARIFEVMRLWSQFHYPTSLRSVGDRWFD
ncbi:hypothetical protein [Ignavibacterium sp.]